MTHHKRIFEGSMVALVTPFKNGKIDEKALKGLLDFHIDHRTDVIIPCGTTGESATMSHDEHRRMMSLVVDHVGGRVPVVCGAGSNNTQEALGLVQHAKKIKADGVLVVTPYYNKPTQEGFFPRIQGRYSGHSLQCAGPHGRFACSRNRGAAGADP
jgi:4-hydroxy-tetrahydrodipicolinate synthase